MEVGRQKVLTHADIPSDQGKSNVEAETVKSDVQTPLPSSGDLDSIAAVKPMDVANVDGEKHASILDYSAKLEGISLEDFFSNEVKSQAPALATNSDMRSDNCSGRATSMDTSGINFRKDSLFWDPLSESIIPDGFDLMANTSETSTNKVVALDNVVGVEEDDDPFSSWEGDFQSAAPAMADVSAASSSHTPGLQLSAQPITLRNTEDVFGDFSNISSVGESVGIQGNNSWVNGGDLFGLDTDVENTFKTDSQRSMDVDNFFGPGWQQSVPRPVVSTTSDGESFGLLNKQSALLKSSQEEELLGILSSKQMETPIINNSLDSVVGEFTSTEDFLMERSASTSSSVGKKNKIVGSLLGQLHDLSFLLADKLVIRTEGKNTKPDSSN